MAFVLDGGHRMLMLKARTYVQSVTNMVVDVDLEKFFDRVNRHSGGPFGRRISG